MQRQGVTILRVIMHDEEGYFFYIYPSLSLSFSVVCHFGLIYPQGYNTNELEVEKGRSTLEDSELYIYLNLKGGIY